MKFDIMKVKVQGAKFVVCHGIYDEEKVVPNHFVVDCAVFFDNPNHELVVDYSVVYALMKNTMEVPRDTLEELVDEIINKIRSKYSFVQKIEVEVKKMNPPFISDLEFVSVGECWGLF
jgi:dihydroneopterin aldolase